MQEAFFLFFKVTQAQLLVKLLLYNAGIHVYSNPAKAVEFPVELIISHSDTCFDTRLMHQSLF